MLIEAGHGALSISRQCALLGVARSSYYYECCRDDSYNEQMMVWIDEEYTRHPFRGVRGITEYLRQALGQRVNPKRVWRLMRQMGLQGVCPRRNLSRREGPPSRVFPYLLRGVEVVRPDQVWAADITYIRMQPGWLYLVAILDWYSRYVVSWELSNSLDENFCVAALERALENRRPEIFNSDQGTQFTGEAFVSMLQGAQVGISWTGTGRVFDNIFVERLWRTVKYEEVYLNEYRTVREARDGLGRYLRFYNDRRYHQALGNRTPRVVYEAETLTN